MAFLMEMVLIITNDHKSFVKTNTEILLGLIIKSWFFRFDQLCRRGIIAEIQHGKYSFVRFSIISHFTLPYREYPDLHDLRLYANLSRGIRIRDTFPFIVFGGLIGRFIASAEY